MCKFSARIATRALEIMDIVCQHPCAKIFISPISPDMMSLSLIREKILCCHYKTLAEWRKDMNLIQQNAYSFYSTSSYEYLLAVETVKIFEREFEKLNNYSLARWSKTYNNLLLKMQMNYEKMPNFLKTQSILAGTLLQCEHQVFPSSSNNNLTLNTQTKNIQSSKPVVNAQNNKCSEFSFEPIEVEFENIGNEENDKKKIKLIENEFSFFMPFGSFYYDPILAQFDEKLNISIDESVDKEKKEENPIIICSLQESTENTPPEADIIKNNDEVTVSVTAHGKMPMKGNFASGKTPRQIQQTSSKAPSFNKPKIHLNLCNSSATSPNPDAMSPQYVNTIETQNTVQKPIKMKLTKSDSTKKHTKDHNWIPSSPETFDDESDAFNNGPVDFHAISEFMVESTALMDISDVYHMAYIIHKYEPDIDLSSTRPEIDILKLKPETQRALIRYAKTARS